MNKWKMCFLHFAKDRIYMWALALTAVAAYGFLLTHHTVGIDDTPYSLYFEEGLAAIVGRWVMFLLNKVVHVAEFIPFLTDFAGVLLLVAAVIVWGMLFYSLLGERIPRYGYLFFSCIFLSCPLISEVFVYHLHNGVALGYLVSGVSLCLFLDGLDFDKSFSKRRRFVYFTGALACLWIALGCYESFMMVWLMGVCLILLSKRMGAEKIPAVENAMMVLSTKKAKILPSIGVAGLLALCAMILRSLTIAGVTAAFGLEELQEAAVQRSVTEFFGWLFEADALAEFAMGLKRTYVMYVVFGCAYYPIGVFLAATAVIVTAGIVLSIRKKDVWILLLTVAVYGAAFSLIIIEGKETYYRCAQFLPVLCGFGAMLFAWGVNSICEMITKRHDIKACAESRETDRKEKVMKCVRDTRLLGCSRVLTCVVLSVVLWNQCMDMNKWFYVDWQKYEAAKETMHNVAYELEQKFDTSKPVAFTGIYEIPAVLIQDAYVSYSEPEYATMIHLTNWLDPHLLEKFYRSSGVWVVQQPMLSVIEWGRTAFGDDSELVKFFRMHGYDLKPCTDAAIYGEAEAFSQNLPFFPQEGSIVDMGECIVVHF